MTKSTKTQNRHPVDQLFDVRERIKALEVEEKALRADIIRTGETNGDEHVAMIKESTRKLLDRPALEARFGREAIAACCKDSPVTTLSLYKKVEQVDVFG